MYFKLIPDTIYTAAWKSEENWSSDAKLKLIVWTMPLTYDLQLFKIHNSTRLESAAQEAGGRVTIPGGV